VRRPGRSRENSERPAGRRRLAPADRTIPPLSPATGLRCSVRRAAPCPVANGLPEGVACAYVPCRPSDTSSGNPPPSGPAAGPREQPRFHGPGPPGNGNHPPARPQTCPLPSPDRAAAAARAQQAADAEDAAAVRRLLAATAHPETDRTSPSMPNAAPPRPRAARRRDAEAARVGGSSTATRAAASVRQDAATGPFPPSARTHDQPTAAQNPPRTWAARFGS
jgi:hypothetical protein